MVIIRQTVNNSISIERKPLIIYLFLYINEICQIMLRLSDKLFSFKIEIRIKTLSKI